MKNIISVITNKNLWLSIAVFIISLLVWFIIKSVFNKTIKRQSANDKAKTHTHFITNIAKYLLIILTVLAIMQINGINVSSYLTGIGIIGIIVGFALQDILKDFINGANIIWENYFAVGDVVRYGENEYKVISLSMRATTMADIENGNVLTVSNRNISEISVVPNWFILNIPAPYSVPKENMRKICEKICERINSVKSVDGCSFEGADKFAESQIEYKIFVYGSPENRPLNRRAANSVILDVFAENGIDIPYNQLDVHLSGK